MCLAQVDGATCILLWDQLWNCCQKSLLLAMEKRDQKSYFGTPCHCLCLAPCICRHRVLPLLLICAELWCMWQQYACWEEGWYIILDGAAPIHGISSGDFHCCLSENEHTRNNYQTHCFVLSSSLPPWNYCTLKEIVLIKCLYLEFFGIFMIAMYVLLCSIFKIDCRWNTIKTYYNIE